MLPINPNKYPPATATPEATTPLLSPASVSAMTQAGLKIATAGACGTFEMSSIHPVDTAVKRLMNHKTPLTSFNAIHDAVFQQGPHTPLHKRVGELNQASRVAAGYTVCKRAYKFGTQPLFKELLEKRHGVQFENRFGPETAEVMLNATAGSLCGMGTVLFLPLETLTVKSQLENDHLKKNPVSTSILENGPARFYRGAGWAIVRNAPGSFVLFGLNSAVQALLEQDTPEKSKTLLQQASGSMAGVAGSILITNPIDVVKTRLQATPLNEETTGLQIASDLLRNEGASAFFKGLGPRLLIIAPKVALTMTLVQQLHQKLTSPVQKDSFE